MSLGPAGEILRLAGERAAHLHGEVDAALREGLAEFVQPDGSVRRAGLDVDRLGDRAGYGGGHRLNGRCAAGFSQRW